MTADPSREISIFLAAIEEEDPDELVAFLDEACGSDHELRALVKALVATHRKGDSFLEQPAPGLHQTANINEAALDAGLSETFGAEAAIVIGDAGHSVLKSLSQRLPQVPRVVLREANEDSDKIVRPNSQELPTAQAEYRYQLHGEIARGGMGAIIKARDTDLGRDLAIKVLLDSHKEKPEVLQRFIEEAQIGGQLQHPGIAPVYELGQFGDRRPFFSMKLVKGETLASLLTQRKDPADDLPRLLSIYEQVCQTMAYAHNKGVIHRDLKPANIMVGAFGEVQVMDWGLAKVLGTGGVHDEKKSLNKHRDISVVQTRRSVDSDSPGDVGSQTQMGSVMGTPAYMPPEQALGEIDRLDERADVFGLGAILSEVLTGKPPYVGADGTEIVIRGRVRPKGDLASKLDMNYCLNYLLKRSPGITPPSPIAEAGFDWKKGWSFDLRDSQEGRGFLSTLPHYFVKLHSDGTFTVHGVTEGEYQFAVSIYEPPEGCLIDPVGLDVFEFEVTQENAEHGIVDLGVIEVGVKLGPQVGDPFPVFRYEEFSSDEVGSVSDWHGRYVLVDFWATWCGPCIAQIPELKSLAKRLDPDRAILLSISLDEKLDQARAFIEGKQMDWPQALLGDRDNPLVRQQLGISSVPIYFVIDPEGNLVHRSFRLPDAVAALDKALDNEEHSP